MKRGKPLARRTPLRTVAPLVRRTPLRARSPMKASRPQPAVPVDVRAVLAERSAGWCELNLAVAGCWGRATDPHHRITRKAGGRHRAAKKSSDRLSGLLHLCRPCHRWIHEHPAEAETFGWLFREGVAPPEVPVLRRGEWVFLDDAGGVHDYEEASA